MSIYRKNDPPQHATSSRRRWYIEPILLRGGVIGCFTTFLIRCERGGDVRSTLLSSLTAFCIVCLLGLRCRIER